MLNTFQPQQGERELEEYVFNRFGKIFYQTKNIGVARRKFGLTRAMLQDIMADCGTDAKLQECEPRFYNTKNKVQFPIAGRRLVSFVAVGRYGRYTIEKEGYDSSFFVSTQTLVFARQVHWYLARTQAAT